MKFSFSSFFLFSWSAGVSLSSALLPSHPTRQQHDHTIHSYSNIQLNLVPYPKEVHIGFNSLQLLPEIFSMEIVSCTSDCDILQDALERYSKLIFPSIGKTQIIYRLSIFENRINAPVPNPAVDQLMKLNVIVTSKESVPLQLGVDESYSLDIPDAKEATLTATTVWGALRGLETFSQIIQYQTTDVQEPGYYMSWTPIFIKDEPRYPWRGLLIDSSRHYLSVPLLEKTIDSMAALKLNTLHWHIVDAESFPFVSSKYPELQKKATYHPMASYTPETISHLVTYANSRGVRIVPEFDTPGHTAAIGQAYPDLIADCYEWLTTHYGSDLRWSMWDSVALDVTKDETKVFVENVMTEMSALFPDKYFHIGGDEVNQGCWAAVPSIQTYMQKNGYATYNSTTESWVYDYTSLQGSWTAFVQEVTESISKTSVVWEESFTLGFPLINNTLVHIWLPDDGSNTLQHVLESGYKVLLSNGWYLDRQAPTCADNSNCDVNWMWMWSGRDMYSIEPLAPSQSGWVPSEEQAKLILGGEAASWGESVDDKNFDARVWSRIPGIAERLWSPASNTDPWLLQPRISALACKLAKRGVQIADSQPAFCDYYEEL